LKKADFAEIAFAPGPGGKQENVVLAVYAGRYDIGSIREGTLDVVTNKIDISQIRVRAHTRWYPGWVFAAKRGLDEQTVSAIQGALCRLEARSKQYPEILEAADVVGIIPAEDKDFTGLREHADTLGMNLAQLGPLALKHETGF
jgi:phosphonate transport system substrate-binding protein